MEPLFFVTIYGALVSTVALALRWSGRRKASQIRTAAKRREYDQRMSLEGQEHRRLTEELERQKGYNEAGTWCLDKMEQNLDTANSAAAAQQERVRGAGEARTDLKKAIEWLLGAGATIREQGAPQGIRRAVATAANRVRRVMGSSASSELPHARPEPAQQSGAGTRRPPNGPGRPA